MFIYAINFCPSISYIWNIVTLCGAPQNRPSSQRIPNPYPNFFIRKSSHHRSGMPAISCSSSLSKSPMYPAELTQQHFFPTGCWHQRKDSQTPIREDIQITLIRGEHPILRHETTTSSSSQKVILKPKKTYARKNEQQERKSIQNQTYQPNLKIKPWHQTFKWRTYP